MALFDDIPVFEDILGGGNWMTGLAIGVGALVALPLAAPILRPVAKTAIKGGILAYRGAAGLVDGIGDLVAGGGGGCHPGCAGGGGSHMKGRQNGSKGSRQKKAPVGDHPSIMGQWPPTP